MTTKPNFYEILGVEQNSGEHIIKKAYRALSLKYHPDRNPSADAMEKIQQINEAYETLGDAAKRRQYDAFLQNPNMVNMGGGGDVDVNDFFNMMFGGGFPGGPPGGFPGGPGVHVFHGNPFEHMFSGGTPFPDGNNPFFNSGRMNKPVPIMKTVTLTMEQCYNGASIPVEIERWFTVNNSKTIEKETIYINVHQGIDENEMLIMTDQGNVISDFCRGDIKISFKINNTTPFIRQGLDLIYKKTITLKEALCGFAFDIMHLNGKPLQINNITNPSVIKPNTKRVIPSLGMIRDSNTGNLIIEFNVEFPESITNEAKTILESIL